MNYGNFHDYYGFLKLILLRKTHRTWQMVAYWLAGKEKMDNNCVFAGKLKLNDDCIRHQYWGDCSEETQQNNHNKLQ